MDRIYINISLSLSFSLSLSLSVSLTLSLCHLICLSFSITSFARLFRKSRKHNQNAKDLEPGMRRALENFGLLLVQFPVWWCLWTITTFIGSSRAAKGKASQLPKTMVLKHIQHLRCRCLIMRFEVSRNKVQMQQASFQKWGFARAKYQDLWCLLFLIHLAARQGHLYPAKVKQTKTPPFIFGSFQFLRLIVCFYRLLLCKASWDIDRFLTEVGQNIDTDHYFPFSQFGMVRYLPKDGVTQSMQWMIAHRHFVWQLWALHSCYQCQLDPT